MDTMQHDDRTKGDKRGSAGSEMVAETVMAETRRVSCDGADQIRGGKGYRPSALGHPRVYLEIDERGYVDCGYCDRRFVLKGGPADPATAS